MHISKDILDYVIYANDQHGKNMGMGIAKYSQLFNKKIWISQ